MADCEVLPLPPRWVPRRLWSATVSNFYVDDGVELQELPWGVQSVAELRPGVAQIRLHYTAPNELWMRKATVAVSDIEGRLVVYRARLMPFLKPRVAIIDRTPTG